jgi:hypothetical protein
MKLTIIPSDSCVYVNNHSYSELDISFCPSDVHALQWNETFGWVEFKKLNDGTTPKNQEINQLPEWANLCVTAWESADYNSKNPTPLTPEQIILSNKKKASSFLIESDFSVLPDVNLQNKQEWLDYRSALRLIIIDNLQNPEWPTKPEAVW